MDAPEISASLLPASFRLRLPICSISVLPVTYILVTLWLPPGVCQGSKVAVLACFLIFSVSAYLLSTHPHPCPALGVLPTPSDTAHRERPLSGRRAYNNATKSILKLPAPPVPSRCVPRPLLLRSVLRCSEPERCCDDCLVPPSVDVVPTRPT